MRHLFPFLYSLYLGIFLNAWCFCKNVGLVLHGHFVICICPSLVWIDVSSIKHYLNATKAKQSAMNAWKPLISGRKPHLCSRPFGSSFGPSSLAPIGIRHLLLSSLTTGFKSVGSWFSTCAVPPQKTHVLRLAVSTSERPSHELTLIGHSSDWCQQCLMLLVGWQERHPACKNWVAGCWHRYLSAARCILACGPVKK